MAIPLSMPNSDDIEDSHRLDLLLEQLLITLRQVLMHRRRVAAYRTSNSSSYVRHRHEPLDRTRMTEEEEEEGTGEEEGSTTRVTTTTEEAEDAPSPVVQLPLPDLVMGGVPSAKDSGRQSAVTSCRHHHHCRHQQQSRRRDPATEWLESGSELIRLAGQLLDQEEVDGENGGKVSRKRGGEEVEKEEQEEDAKREKQQQQEQQQEEEKKKMNVLSLVCPLLGNSVWTTVALLVVWGLISRTAR